MNIPCLGEADSLGLSVLAPPYAHHHKLDMNVWKLVDKSDVTSSCETDHPHAAGSGSYWKAWLGTATACIDSNPRVRSPLHE